MLPFTVISSAYRDSCIIVLSTLSPNVYQRKQRLQLQRVRKIMATTPSLWTSVAAAGVRSFKSLRHCATVLASAAVYFCSKDDFLLIEMMLPSSADPLASLPFRSLLSLVSLLEFSTSPSVPIIGSWAVGTLHGWVAKYLLVVSEKLAWFSRLDWRLMSASSGRPYVYADANTVFWGTL